MLATHAQVDTQPDHGHVQQAGNRPRRGAKEVLDEIQAHALHRHMLGGGLDTMFHERLGGMRAGDAQAGDGLLEMGQEPSLGNAEIFASALDVAPQQAHYQNVYRHGGGDDHQQDGIGRRHDPQHHHNGSAMHEDPLG